MRPGWQPGAEPGIDINQKEEDEMFENLHADCDITVVDFSPERMQQYELNNSTIKEFLDQPREEWVSARWVCVNGLSSDVIKVLAKHNGMGMRRLEAIGLIC